MSTYPHWILEAVKTNKTGLRAARSLSTIGDLSSARLRTVCDEALCPNKGKCFASGEATFLILGDVCTRACRFCAVSKDAPGPPDADEPRRVGELSKKWGLKYVVFTSPTRDDLPDGGAAHFAETTRSIKNSVPGAGTEPLIPDLRGDITALAAILEANPDVLGHNIETVPALYGRVRIGADYKRSLRLIQDSKRLRPDIPAKSGLMLGLGEKESEIESALADLLGHGCDLLTLGQYLAPSKSHLPVERYVTPEEFAAWEAKAVRMGFKAALCGPLVRSSYQAGELYQKGTGSVRARQ